jgi:hypothetical protein
MNTNPKANHAAGAGGKSNRNETSFRSCLEDRHYDDLVEYAGNHQTESFNDYLQAVVQYAYRIENHRM